MIVSFTKQRWLLSQVCAIRNGATRQREAGAGLNVNTVGDLMVISELDLGKVAVQMLLAAMLVHALHAALEDRERAPNSVDMFVAAHILAISV